MSLLNSSIFLGVLFGRTNTSCLGFGFVLVFGEEAAQNASASVGNDAGTRALGSFNLNDSAETTTVYGPRGTVPPVRYRESEFTALYGAPGDRTSPAASTYLGGAESTQGATAYPVVDYFAPGTGILTQEQLDAEEAEERRLAGP